VLKTCFPCHEAIKSRDLAFTSVTVPDTLKSVAFIEKDSKRFPDSSGWGYGQFNYDAASGTFKPFGDDSSFATKCYKCHTIVKEKDYIFTAYPER
jgi:hypothetical protein